MATAGRPHLATMGCGAFMAAKSFTFRKIRRITAWLRLTTHFALFVQTAGHGAMVWPPSRNAVDRFLPEFTNGRSPSASCNCGNDTLGCAEGSRSTGGGQSCLWFSQGCTIGCASCTGIGSHTQRRLCKSAMEPTLPRWAWTMNRHVEEGSAQDTYRYNPWRAPGFAPVFDACGRAGGTDRGHFGPGVAVFADTFFAKGGDMGSEVLPPASSGVMWRAGDAVEVSWGIRFNHGGGYQYRLCRSDETLTEACFQRLPLEFVRGSQELQWNNGSRAKVAGTYVDVGTSPSGSTWAMNPIPRINFDSYSSGQPAGSSGCTLVNGTPVGAACRAFTPPCNDSGWFPVPPHATSIDVEGECSGDWIGGSVVDSLVIPDSLPPGEYVLGWRWDCEESDQVWASCADVTITPPRNVWSEKHMTRRRKGRERRHTEVHRDIFTKFLAAAWSGTTTNVRTVILLSQR